MIWSFNSVGPMSSPFLVWPNFSNSRNVSLQVDRISPSRSEPKKLVGPHYTDG